MLQQQAVLRYLLSISANSCIKLLETASFRTLIPLKLRADHLDIKQGVRSVAVCEVSALINSDRGKVLQHRRAAIT